MGQFAELIDSENRAKNLKSDKRVDADNPLFNEACKNCYHFVLMLCTDHLFPVKRNIFTVLHFLAEFHHINEDGNFS